MLPGAPRVMRPVPPAKSPASAPTPVQKTISPRAWVELFLLATIWGASFLSNRIALTEVGVFTTVAIRVLGAATLLWLIVLYLRLPIPGSARVWAIFLGMGLLNNAIPFSLIVWGQQHIASGLASILNAATAIIGVLIASLIFADERLTRRRMVGVGLGFLGVATAIGWQAASKLDLTSLAQLAVIGSSLSYALAGAFGRVFLKGVAPLVAAAGMLTGSSLIMVPMALATEGMPRLASLTAPTIAALAYLAVFASALAYMLYYRVLAMAGAGNLLLVTLLVSPIAILLGTLVLGESLLPQAYLGFGLVALGMLVIDGRLLNWLGRFRH